jgi:hypothetical protein
MNPTVHRARPARAIVVTLLALTALLGACKSYNPVDEPDGDPDATPRPTAVTTPAPTQDAAAPTATADASGSIHVVLAVATDDEITVDVADESSLLVSAATGTPGDGASIEAYRLLATNLTPTSIRLTWVGGPCDSANRLLIDAKLERLLLVQPECSGDAIANDRILDLTFSTPVNAGDFETFLQDGLDS